MASVLLRQISHQASRSLAQPAAPAPTLGTGRGEKPGSPGGGSGSPSFWAKTVPDQPWGWLLSG